MRVFIENIELSQLVKKITNKTTLQLVNTKHRWELYSDEGIFSVLNQDEKNKDPGIYKWIVTNEKQEKIQDLHLRLDHSQITYQKAHQIPCEHVAVQVQYNTYTFNPSSNVKFVVKLFVQEDRLTLMDVYFECEQQQQKEPVLEEINAFLESFVCKND